MRMFNQAIKKTALRSEAGERFFCSSTPFEVLRKPTDSFYFSAMIRLAIVDDELRIAQLLKRELQDFPEIGSIQLFSSGTEFVKELAAMNPRLRPEVVIMDISMGTPEEGILTTREVKTRYPSIEIVIFSISDDDDRIFDAFKAGAHAYLLKNERPTFILKTILDVKNGGSQMSPSIARKTIRWLAPEPTIAKTPQQEALTKREREVLEFVGRGLTYDQVGAALDVSPLTVKKHMGNVFRKMQVNNKIEALRKAQRHR
jgi:DNA-binding NarL/FixJ family response regulator